MHNFVIMARHRLSQTIVFKLRRLTKPSMTSFGARPDPVVSTPGSHGRQTLPPSGLCTWPIITHLCHLDRPIFPAMSGDRRSQISGMVASRFRAITVPGDSLKHALINLLLTALYKLRNYIYNGGEAIFKVSWCLDSTLR